MDEQGIFLRTFSPHSRRGYSGCHLGTAAFYFWKKVNTCEPELIDRLLIKSALVTLRKRVFSSLREMAFIINQIRTLEGDLEPKKISDIFMRDGGKLGSSQAAARRSCKPSKRWCCRTSTSHVRPLTPRKPVPILLQLLHPTRHRDQAVAGPFQERSQHGPGRSCGKLPWAAASLHARKGFEDRGADYKKYGCGHSGRMQIISRKFMDGASNEECLRLEAQM